MTDATSPRSRFDLEPWLVGLAVAGLTVLYCLRNGTYDVVVRGELAMLIWVALGVGWASGLLPRTRPTRMLWPAATGFLLLAVWTIVCLRWTESDERTVVELGRVAHHAGVFLLAASLLGPRTWRAALGGLTLGLTVVCWIALCNWLWPDSVSTDYIRTVFGVKRLSYPLAYFNGMGTLGVMTALGGLAWATHARGWWLRALAIAPMPGVLVMAYLTYSRGSVLELGVGVIVLLASARHRIPTLITGLVVAGGTALTILALRDHQAIVEGSGSAGAQAVIGYAVASGLVAAAVAIVLSLAQADDRLRLPTRFGRPAIAALCVAVLVVLAVATPTVIRRAGDSLDTQGVNSASNPTLRFTSLGGGRLDQFRAAADEWKRHPVEGTGPGTYEFTWNRDPRYVGFVRDTHDLYLEALSESGVPGLLALLVAIVGLAVLAILAAVRARTHEDRGAAAIVITTLAVFLTAAAVDWVWELTVLTFVPLLGAGAAAASLGDGRYERALRPGRIVVPVIALLAVLAILPVVVSTSNVRASQADARHDRPERALRRADDAIDAAPWSATAMAQKSLLLEAAGRLRNAEGYAILAMDREPTNWRFALLRARLRAARGDAAGAVRYFRLARRLAPRKAALQ